MKTTLKEIQGILINSEESATKIENGITLNGFIFSSDLAKIMQVVTDNEDRIYLSESGCLKIR